MPGNEYFGADVVNFVFEHNAENKPIVMPTPYFVRVSASLDRHINLDWWVSALVSIEIADAIWEAAAVQQPTNKKRRHTQGSATVR